MTRREALSLIRSRTLVLDVPNIDTDQVIPARFLKGTSRDGLGRALFAGWRYDAVGGPRSDFVLNQPQAAGAQILVTGPNFGCGSSREHAVWALRDFGFRAVVSPSFAEIFEANALKNGLLPVKVGPALHRRLTQAPGTEVVVDLEAQRLTLPDGASEAFPIAAFARRCLLEGIDELQFLLDQHPAIAAFERGLAGSA